MFIPDIPTKNKNFIFLFAKLKLAGQRQIMAVHVLKFLTMQQAQLCTLKMFLL